MVTFECKYCGQYLECDICKPIEEQYPHGPNSGKYDCCLDCIPEKIKEAYDDGVTDASLELTNWANVPGGEYKAELVARDKRVRVKVYTEILEKLEELFEIIEDCQGIHYPMDLDMRVMDLRQYLIEKGAR